MNDCPMNMHAIDKTVNLPKMTLGVGVFQVKSPVVSCSRHSASVMFITKSLFNDA